MNGLATSPARFVGGLGAAWTDSASSGRRVASAWDSVRTFGPAERPLSLPARQGAGIVARSRKHESNR